MDLEKAVDLYTNIRNKIPIVGKILENRSLEKAETIIYAEEYLSKRGVLEEDKKRIIQSLYSPLGIAFGKAATFRKRTKRNHYDGMKGKKLVSQLQTDLSSHTLNLEDLE